MDLKKCGNKINRFALKFEYEKFQVNVNALLCKANNGNSRFIHFCSMDQSKCGYRRNECWNQHWKKEKTDNSQLELKDTALR